MLTPQIWSGAGAVMPRVGRGTRRVGGAPGQVVEVAGVVSGADAPVGVTVDQVELDLRVDVASEAGLGDPS